MGINIYPAVAGKFVHMVCYFIILFLYSSIINLLFNYPLKLQRISVRITKIGLMVSYAHGTIVSHLQYVWRSCMARGPTSYPSNISRHLDLSKASCALCSSRNITYRTSYLKATSCWISLASRVAVPVPRPALNPWRKSWKVMEAVSRRFKIYSTTFHITSTRPMHR